MPPAAVTESLIQTPRTDPPPLPGGGRKAHARCRRARPRSRTPALPQAHAAPAHAHGLASPAGPVASPGARVPGAFLGLPAAAPEPLSPRCGAEGGSASPSAERP